MSSYWVNDEHAEDYDAWLNEMLELSPDSWDGDESADSILTRFVVHLVDEVKRRGGCLHPFCHWNDGDPCDHGYLNQPQPVVLLSDAEGRVIPFPVGALS